MRLGLSPKRVNVLRGFELMLEALFLVVISLKTVRYIFFLWVVYHLKMVIYHKIVRSVSRSMSAS